MDDRHEGSGATGAGYGSAGMSIGEGRDGCGTSSTFAPTPMGALQKRLTDQHRIAINQGCTADARAARLAMVMERLEAHPEFAEFMAILDELILLGVSPFPSSVGMVGVLGGQVGSQSIDKPLKTATREEAEQRSRAVRGDDVDRANALHRNEVQGNVGGINRGPFRSLD